MATVTFENLYMGDLPELGKLRFNVAGFGFKSYSEEAKAPVTFNGPDIRHAIWIRVARNFQLRLTMKGDAPKLTFEGFKREDQEKVKRTLEDNFHVKMETKDVSLRGYNWGQASVENHEVTFSVLGKPSFELPLSAIANSNIAGKNEVALEFNPPPPPQTDNKDLSRRVPDELVEMRFYVPGLSIRSKGSDAGSDADDEVDVDDEGNEISAAEMMHNQIKEKADIGAVVGESIVLFEDVLILTPRGRYSLEFFNDSLRLLGKSTDYRVPFTSIHRIFLLPKLDDLHVQLVLGLDPPIRQGATRYPFLVAQWPKDEEVDAELNLSEEDVERYPDLQKKYEAPTFQVISRVLKSLTGKKVTPPGGFRNAQGLNGIKANVKAVQGEVYFLEKGLIFIAKQPILIDFSKTESISFSRVGGGIASARTFDMRVASKTDNTDTVFSAISKEEVQPISAFLQSKNVRLKNEMDEVMDIDPISDDDEEDDDVSIPSDDDRPTKGKDKLGKKPTRAAADDEDESEDEDFAGSSSDGGSPSESDDDDSDGGASDASDPMMDELKRKQAAKKAKKAGGKTADSDSEKPAKKKSKSKKEVSDEDDDE